MSCSGRSYALAHLIPQFWGTLKSASPKVGGLGGQNSFNCVSPVCLLGADRHQKNCPPRTFLAGFVCYLSRNYDLPSLTLTELLSDFVMKRLVFCGLSVLVMSVAIAPSVKAETVETTTANPTALSNTPSASERLTPFNLVQQAYRGSFMAQGIPNYRTLSAACQSGRINGSHLIQAAVDGKRLSSDMLSDRTYLFNVNNMLNAINND